MKKKRTAYVKANRPKPLLSLLGPAFIAAIAYVDPGNVAANVTAGARYGYLLIWVLVLANLMAIAIQYQSAKLGLVAGRSLPEIIGNKLSRPARLLYWVQAELVALATDLAEIIGGAIALQLLFNLPLLWGGSITATISLGLLLVQSRRSQKQFEFVIIGLLLIITAGFLTGLVLNPPPLKEVASGLVPRIQGSASLIVAASMLGATVMPHAIYLHSSLVNHHHGHLRERTIHLPRLLRVTRIDVGIALTIAGTVNIGLLLLAASALRGIPGTDDIAGAHSAIATAYGPAIGTIFAIGLLASGLASTSVGSYAGSEIMKGLIHRNIPLPYRRVLTILPALVLLSVGINPTEALVISQALLSFGIPFALIPLVRLTSSKSVMGAYQDGVFLRIFSWFSVSIIVGLNILLLVFTVGM